MSKRNRREVTKEEFDAFLASYPRPLERDVSGIPEPPVLSYNDFSEGKVWPESVVASVQLYERYPRDRAPEDYGWAPNRYFLMTREEP